MEYLLMYKDMKVLRFDTETYEIGLLNQDYMPVCIKRQNENYAPFGRDRVRARSEKTDKILV